MNKYKVEKEYRHDYASSWEKLKYKIHNTFYSVVKDRTKAYPLYRSYRHRNVTREKTPETSFYMTEKPNVLAGFGHGFGSWRSGYVNAKRLGVDYAYSPMVNKSWDDAMGLGYGFEKAEDLIANKGYKKVLLPYYNMDSEASRSLIKKIMNSYNGQKVVFYNEHEQPAADGDNIYGDALIRELFWKSPRRNSDKIVYENEEGTINVALHIRRGDVSALLKQGDQSMLKRWLDNSYYTVVMEQLLECVNDPDRIVFSVFSEGEEDQFADLLKVHNKVNLYNRMSAEDSFVNLCYADIIVTAPSSFSIIAGAINKGLKLYPDKDWLVIPDNEEWEKVNTDGKLGNTAMDKVREIITV